MRLIKRFLAVFLLLLLVYLVGPNPTTPIYDNRLPIIPTTPNTLEKYISEQESAHRLKPDNDDGKFGYKAKPEKNG